MTNNMTSSPATNAYETPRTTTAQSAWRTSTTAGMDQSEHSVHDIALTNRRTVFITLTNHIAGTVLTFPLVPISCISPVTPTCSNRCDHVSDNILLCYDDNVDTRVCTPALHAAMPWWTCRELGRMLTERWQQHQCQGETAILWDAAFNGIFFCLQGIRRSVP